MADQSSMSAALGAVALDVQETASLIPFKLSSRLESDDARSPSAELSRGLVRPSVGHGCVPDVSASLRALRRSGFRVCVLCALAVVGALLLSAWFCLGLRDIDRPHGLSIPYTAAASDASAPSAALYSSAALSSPPPSLHRRSCERRYPLQQSHFNLTRPRPPQRVFIAINLRNSEAILPSMIAELTRLLTALCDPAASGPSPSSPACPNVHLSIYESDSSDSTAALLDVFAFFLRSLSVPHTLSTHAQLQRASAYRIDHLAAVRNLAIAPLTRMSVASTSPPFDRVVFLNDVVFCAEDVLRLLWLSAAANASMVCGLDYDDVNRRGPQLYDTWVARGTRGRRPTKAWPYFAEEDGGREVRLGALASVFCCWNGLVVMDAREWWEYGLSFRAHDEEGRGERCEASECSHVCEDYHAIHGTATRILVDPTVHVAYERSVYEDIERQGWWRQQHHARMQNESARLSEVHSMFSGADWLDDAGRVDWECCDLANRCGIHRVPRWSGTKRSYGEQGQNAVLGV